MNSIKSLAPIGAGALTIAAFIASIKLGIVVLIAVLVLTRLLRGSSNSGGIIGVDQQGQAHGEPRDEGNGGVGRQTFPSAWQRRP